MTLGEQRNNMKFFSFKNTIWPLNLVPASSDAATAAAALLTLGELCFGYRIPFLVERTKTLMICEQTAWKSRLICGRTMVNMSVSLQAALFICGTRRPIEFPHWIMFIWWSNTMWKGNIWQNVCWLISWLPVKYFSRALLALFTTSSLAWPLPSAVLSIISNWTWSQPSSPLSFNIYWVEIKVLRKK